MNLLFFSFTCADFLSLSFLTISYSLSTANTCDPTAMVNHMANFELAPPLDLTHHYSDVSKHRTPSAIKSFYRYFTIPGIGNLAGGLPNPGYFPFETLEASAARPSRFKSSLAASTTNSNPSSRSYSPDSDHGKLSTDPSPIHVSVPHDSRLPNKLDRIDIDTALQYGTAAGYPPLASFIHDFTLKHLHPNIPYKNSAEIILTCGNTDGFAKTIECFTDPWSETCGRPLSERQGLLCERFAYMNAVQTARPRGMNIVPIAIDAEGMLAYGDERCLYNVLSDWNVERDGGRRPHIMYTVTMGQNPTSGLLSVKRRKEIYGICQKFDVLIVEDDPYFYIQFPHVANELSLKWRGEPASLNHFAEQGSNYQTDLAVPVRGTVTCNSQKHRTTRMKHGVTSGYEFLDSLVPSYLSLDVDGRVIRLDTFSKTIAPGCRLGWITAQPEFIDRLLRITDVSTQQPSGFVQSMVAELLIGPDHKEKYQALKNDRHKKKDIPAASGWQTDGWVRWLDGLRGNYERRMRCMVEILEAGKSTTMSESVRTTDGRKMQVVIRGTPRARPDPTVPTCSHGRASLTRYDSYSSTISEDNFEMLSRTQIYDFNMPMAGMFVWIHFTFDIHPLVNQFTGQQLAQAFWVFQTRKPYLILTAPGTIFAPTEEIRQQDSWQYFRLCFAAVEEDSIKDLSKNFVRAAHDYWEIEDPKLIQEMLDESSQNTDAMAQEVLSRLGRVPFVC